MSSSSEAVSDNLILDFDALGKPVGVTLEHYFHISDSSTIETLLPIAPALRRNKGKVPQPPSAQKASSQSLQRGILLRLWLPCQSLPREASTLIPARGPICCSSPLNDCSSRRPAQPPELDFTIHYSGRLHDDLSLRLLHASADVMVMHSRHDAFG